MSLLGRTFAFLGHAVYNASPPPATPGQPTVVQCDANGRLVVTVAAVRGGGNDLTPPIATAAITIPTPSISNAYRVTQAFNSASGSFAIKMPVGPIPGMRVTLVDTGGHAATSPCAVSDLAGNKLQNPLALTTIASTYSFAFSGFAATWMFVAGDPTNGNFWAVVRSLQ